MAETGTGSGGVVTPQELNNGFGIRVPDWERYLAVLVDPGIGLLPFMPALAAFGLWGTIRVLQSGAAEPVIGRCRAAALWAGLLTADSSELSSLLCTVRLKKP